MTVDPPTTDPLIVDTENVTTIRPYEDLVVATMQMRACSYPEAEAYIEKCGETRVEAELRVRFE